MGHFVYKYVFEDEIIYIGKNDTDLISRLNCHGKKGDNIDEQFWDKINKSKIYYAEFPDSYTSDAIETLLIKKYNPICNKAKKGVFNISFDEPEWILFNGLTKTKKEPAIKNKNVDNDSYFYFYKKYFPILLDEVKHGRNDCHVQVTEEEKEYIQTMSISGEMLIYPCFLGQSFNLKVSFNHSFLDIWWDHEKNEDYQAILWHCLNRCNSSVNDFKEEMEMNLTAEEIENEINKIKESFKNY